MDTLEFNLLQMFKSERFFLHSLIYFIIFMYIGNIDSWQNDENNSNRDSHHEILEIHNTGRSQRLDDLLGEYAESVFPTTKAGKDRAAAIQEFMTIKYIGRSKANKLYDSGYRTLDDVLNDKQNLLTHAQKLFAESYHDLKEKIPRAEIKNWETKI